MLNAQIQPGIATAAGFSPALAQKLLDLLTSLYGAHEELLQTLQAQQQAIRRFDAAGLEKLRARAERAAQRIAELEEARVRLTGQNVRLGELAERLPEPHRGRLAALSAGLRNLAQRASAISRVNETAVRNMLNHFHTVYQMMASHRVPQAYTAAGRTAPGSGKAFLVDAVA